jgi:hypothetical protein
MLRAAIAVDDIASVTPWRARGVEARRRGGVRVAFARRDEC